MRYGLEVDRWLRDAESEDRSLAHRLGGYHRLAGLKLGPELALRRDLVETRLAIAIAERGGSYDADGWHWRAVRQGDRRRLTVVGLVDL